MLPENITPIKETVENLGPQEQKISKHSLNMSKIYWFWYSNWRFRCSKFVQTSPRRTAGKVQHQHGTISKHKLISYWIKLNPGPSLCAGFYQSNLPQCKPWIICWHCAIQAGACLSKLGITVFVIIALRWKTATPSSSTQILFSAKKKDHADKLPNWPTWTTYNDHHQTGSILPQVQQVTLLTWHCKATGVFVVWFVGWHLLNIAIGLFKNTPHNILTIFTYTLVDGNP